MHIGVGLLAAALLVTAAGAGSATINATDATVKDGVQAALDALAESDARRVTSDKAYAAKTLEQVETVRKSSVYVGDRVDAIDRLRMFALIGTGQAQAAYNQSLDLLKRNPNDSGIHYFALTLATELGGNQTMVQLEQADALLTDRGARSKLADGLDLDFVYYARRPYHEANDKAKLARSAQLLLKLGVPGPNYPEMAENFRLDIADDMLARGDVAGAREIVHSLRLVDPVMSSLIAKRWSPTWESGNEGERLAQAIAASDDATEQSLRADPADTKLLLKRAQFLRSVGKEQEALQLVLPKAQDFDWVKEQREDGYWIVNEAAYSLAALDRAKEAVALMDRLMTIGLEADPMLISMAINSAGIMMDAGEFRRAAEYSTKLAESHAGIANPYGAMWMWSGAACAHYFLGNATAAKPWVDKLKAGESDNPAALTRTLLCANDLDGTAAAIIRRLNGKDPDSALSAVQTYTAGPDYSPSTRILDQRLQQVLARQDVQSAIASKGRVLKLPLSKIYWGMF